MAEQKKSFLHAVPTKVYLIGAGLILIGGSVWYISHKQRQLTRRSNNATADPNDPATKLAEEWYSALNVHQGVTNLTAGWSFWVSQTEINRIYNVALKTYNYAKLQKIFSALCNDYLALPQAINEALGSKEPEAYKNTINYIGMKKVVTTAASKIYSCKKDGTLAKMPGATTLVSADISKDQCVGAFIDEKKLTVNSKQEPYYIALRSMENGTPAYFAVLKSSCKLM